MHLFIIGNGFDMGHGISTRYWDFRTYLERLYPEFLYAFEEHYYLYPGMSNESKASLLWNELETNLANIDEDVIIENAVSIDMDLDSGDVGIEDTLYNYFSDEYSYIKRLSGYLKQWVRTIRIKGVVPKTSLITPDNFYITFNYTAVLENVYQVSPSNILHIHGSLREYDIDPVLGHGNQKRIESIKEKKEEANRLFDEKWASICRAVEDYYLRTYKDVGKYSLSLHSLSKMEIDGISVIGHSLASVDRTYFRAIDTLSDGKLTWKVYYYSEKDVNSLKHNLIDAGVDEVRIRMISSSNFYDL